MEKNINSSLSEKETKTLVILQQLLEKYYIDPSYYSLYGYCEYAVCLEKSNKNWICFDAERANKYDLKEVTNIEDACLILIQRITSSDEEENIISTEFRKKILEI